MPRRAPDTGQCFLSRTTGLWVVRVRNPHTGVTVSRSRRAWRTQREAQAALDALRDELSRSPPAPSPDASPPLTTADYLAGWLAQKLPQVRPATSADYTYQVRMWNPLIGHIPLTELTAQQLQQALTALLTDEDGNPAYAASTVARARTTLSTALHDAEAYGLVPRNVVRFTRPPRIHWREPVPLDRDEAQRILASVQATRLVAAVTLALCYGLRAGEVCGLRWSNVSESTLRVEAQLARGTLTLAPTKTRISTRTLPLLPPVVDALAQARAGSRSEYIVTDMRGGPLGPIGLYNVWQRHQVKVGLTPRRSFHALRHGTASLLAQLAVPESVAMAIVGHGTVAQHRHYQHLPPDVLTEALGRLSRALTRQAEQ